MSSCCRVHTLAVPIAQDLNALYAGADTGAIASIIAKLAVEKSLHGKLEVPPECSPPMHPLSSVPVRLLLEAASHHMSDHCHHRSPKE